MITINTNIMMTYLFLFTTIIQICCIYLLVHIKNKQFLSTNPKPNIISYDNLEFKQDNIPQKIKTGIIIKGFSIFDINQNRFVLYCNVWFRYPKIIDKIEHLQDFSFLNANSIEKKKIGGIIDNDEFYEEYEVIVDFSCVFDHRLFPLNDHCIYLTLINDALYAHNYILISSLELVNIVHDLEVDDWNMISTTVENGYNKEEIPNSKKQKYHPRILFGLNFKKISLRRFFLLVMPLFIIIYIANFIHLPVVVNLENDTVLKAIIACITTILGYRYILIRLSPNVGYNTFLTKISSFCLFINFFDFLIIFGFILNFKQLKPETFGLFWFYFSKPLMLLGLAYFLFIDPRYYQKTQYNSKRQAFLKKLKRIKPESIQFQKIKNHQTLFLPTHSKILLCLMQQCIELNTFKLSIEKPKRIFILANINHETLIRFIEHMQDQKNLNQDLNLENSGDVIIINQNQLNDPKTGLELLMIECLLIVKNPKQVILLQDSKTILSYLQSHALELHNNVWNGDYKNEVLWLARCFFKKLSQKLTLPFCNNMMIGEQSLFEKQHKNHIIYLLNSCYSQLISDKKPFFSIPTVNAQYCWYLNSSHDNQLSYLEIHETNPYCGIFHSNNNTFFFNLSSGILTDEKSQKKRYQFYSSMDFLQSSRSISQNIYFGLLNQFHASDLLPQDINLNIKNDDYQPLKTLNNIQAFINESKTTPLILAPVGTPTLEYYRHLIETQQVMVLFPISGGSVLRQAHVKNIIYYRASYINELKYLISFVKTSKMSKKIAIFYQNDSYGNFAINGIKDHLQSLRLNWHGFAYERNDPNIKSIAQDIIAFTPDSLLFISTFSPSYALIQQLDYQFLYELNLMAISYAANNLDNYLKDQGLNLIRTHVVPPLDLNIEIVKNYLASTPQMSFPNYPCDEGLEGYIVGDLILQMLQDTNFSQDPQEIKAYFSALKQHHHKGLLLDFNPLTQELHSNIWLETQENSKRIILDYNPNSTDNPSTTNK